MSSEHGLGYQETRRSGAGSGNGGPRARRDARLQSCVEHCYRLHLASIVRPSIRFEIKYRIRPHEADAIARHIVRYMQADEYGEGGSARYPVHSLYLDSPGLRLYRAKAEGAFSRFKLRARCYNFQPARSFFLEVKARKGEAMTKSRGLATLEETRTLLSGAGADRYDPALANFCRERDNLRARPAAWITYDRAAYVGGERSLVRVTFDSDIKVGLPTDDLSEPKQWYGLPEVKGLVVLEIKYTGSYPAWVAQTIRRFDLFRSSMSKYRQGIDVLLERDLLPMNRAV